ncbi:MFS transporter [Marinobacterium lutimaris]|uniref:Predicted arabinose efflux permease, MFS family n=1 Tax=Marinobacterium lutimaris TaxID=568106 RepID=A0A1H6DHL6_9GAMM|nr:MFS transporter [Marinobacterium lutimaris]SEG84711.1 Predicted arabinose efflux permease, MFS family [Marinobacterium lutimaris]
MSTSRALEGEVPAQGDASHGNALSIVILAVAAFVIVTTEFLIVGLLPALSRDLGISVATAGQLVTLFAVVVMLCGPFLTATLAHLNRKKLFISILLLFTGANALAAVAPNIWVLSLARLIPAMALPLFWGTASETAAQIAGPERAGRAVSQVYLGISAAMLLGIPLGTLAADAIGWRGAFALLAALSLLIALLIYLSMPTVKTNERVAASHQARILKDPYFLGNVALSVLVFTAMFAGYTYLAEVLESSAGIASGQVGWWLMGFGAVGLIGNWLGGLWVDQKPLLSTALFCLLLALGMAGSMALVEAPLWFALALGVWGIANTALYPLCQVRVMKAASGAQALAGTINVSAANAGIALGAIIGGVAISVWGVANIGYLSAALALASAVVALLVSRLKPA